MTTQGQLDYYKAQANALIEGGITQAQLYALDAARATIAPDLLPVNGWDLTTGSNNTVLNGGIAIGGDNTADGPNTLVMGLGNYGHQCAFLAGRYANAGTPDRPANDSIALGCVNVYGDNGYAAQWNNDSHGDRAHVDGHRGTDFRQGSNGGVENFKVRGYGGLKYLGDVVGPYGEAQGGELGLRCITNDATPTPMTSAWDLQRRYNALLVVPDHATLFARGMVVARDALTGDSACWEFTAMARRLVGSGSVTVMKNVISSFRDPSAAWTLDAREDTDYGALTLIVRGQAGRSISWVARLIDVEVMTL